MAGPWTDEEIAWARECLHAGDTIEEIAAWAGRTVAEVVGAIGGGRNITPREREVLSLYAAGCSLSAIGQETGRARTAVGAMLSGLRRKGVQVGHRPQGRRVREVTA